MPLESQASSSPDEADGRSPEGLRVREKEKAEGCERREKGNGEDINVGSLNDNIGDATRQGPSTLAPRDGSQPAELRVPRRATVPFHPCNYHRDRYLQIK